MSFRRRIQALLIALVVLVEGATFVAVLSSTRAQILAQGSSQLEAGARVLESAVLRRDKELTTGVRILSADFAFKRAVATGDQATINSALANHGARIDADLALFIDRNRVVTGTAGTQASQLDVRSLASSLQAERGRAGNVASAIATIADKPRQLVVAPIFAPQHIGWVAVGFDLNDDFAAGIAALTNLQVSIASRSDRGRNILASTLGRDDRSDVNNAQSIADMTGSPTNFELTSGSYLALAKPYPGATSTDLEVILAMPLDAVLAAYYSLRTKLLIILAIALLLSAFLARFISGRISKPLWQLSKAAMKISRGDYSSKVAVAGSSETERLSSAFNEMLAGIAEREQRIVFQAQHDALTGLPNRSNIVARIEHAITRADRFKRSFTALQVGLRGIAGINDTLGFETGDLLLKVISDRLKGLARSSDSVGRIANREFMFLLEETSADEAYAFADRILEIFADDFALDKMRLDVGVNIGVVGYPDHCSNAEELMRRSSIALKTGLTRGDGVVVTYEQGSDEENRRRVSLVDDLRAALKNGDLDVYYQPKINLRSRQASSAEALVRWTHPEHGFISPEEFIPLAEKSGHIQALTEYVLHAVMHQLRRWRQQDINICAAVNLSAHDLLDASLPRKIQSLLAEYGLSSSALILEITESAVVDDTALATQIMQELRDIGVKLSIDDFGTGQASLAYLKHLPVDDLKIDKSFVLTLDSSREDAIIVESTIAMAHNMGLTVTAEGVENEASLQLLHDFGCDTIQGYFISKPIPSSEFSSWLEQWNERGNADGHSASDTPDAVLDASGQGGNVVPA